MIARAILADPRDLAVHWVWLPLFHYAQVPLVAAGGTLEDVRWINLALAAVTPWLLFAHVRRTASARESKIPPEAIALLAAVIAAACPIVMQMGTTAQPEPLFELVVLGLAVALERRRDGIASALLAAAVMLRYEAWGILIALAGAFAGVAAWHRWRGARPGAVGADGPREKEFPWVVFVAPVLLIVGWAALRRPVDGRWFGFLRQTQEFATGALGANAAPSTMTAALSFVRELLYYPFVVPGRVLGAALPLVPFGVWRTVRQQGWTFVLVFAACLGFVSLSWAKHGSLGLDRHFVAVVPLYATFAAQGAAAVADGVARLAERRADEATAVRAGRSIAALLAALSLAGLAIELDVWMGFWRDSVARGWPDRAALGAYLRTIPGGSTIFCDDATLEIGSGLDRRRFDRHWIDDQATWDRVHEVARAQGGTYVATWRRKLRGHEKDGRIVFIAGEEPTDPGGTGVAVMRVEADGSRTAR
jgi:GNAT superfamily N-acetyltransferase